jgi:hypothetical protein
MLPLQQSAVTQSQFLSHSVAKAHMTLGKLVRQSASTAYQRCQRRSWQRSPVWNRCYTGSWRSRHCPGVAKGSGSHQWNTCWNRDHGEPARLCSSPDARLCSSPDILLRGKDENALSQPLSSLKRGLHRLSDLPKTWSKKVTWWSCSLTPSNKLISQS